jgi:hypothetical protein
VYGQDARELQGDDSVILERRIAIRIPKDDRWDGATLSGVFTASIAQDLSGSASDPVEIDVALPPGFVTDEAGTGFRGGVNPGDEYLFTIRTAPFPRHQSIIITPTTHLLQASDLRGKNA